MNDNNEKIDESGKIISIKAARGYRLPSTYQLELRLTIDTHWGV